MKPMKIKFKGEKYFKGVFVNFRPILSSQACLSSSDY